MSGKELCRNQKIGLFSLILSCQIIVSIFISYVLVVPNTFSIPSLVADKILTSLIDVSIALFGFVGLILVFTLRNLLSTKGDLQKEEFDTTITKMHTDNQLVPTLLHNKLGLNGVMDSMDIYEKRIEEIKDKIKQNKIQIKNALYYGVMSLGFSVSCTLMSIWAFGAVSNELHFLHVTLPIFLFFMCINCIFMTIRTVTD